MPKRSDITITDRLVRSAKPKNTPYDIRDRDLKGFILRIEPSGAKSYYCTWDRGKRSRIGDAKLMTLERAREIAEQRIAGAKRGEVPRPQIRVRRLTLEKFIDDHYGPWAAQEHRSGMANAKRIRSAFSDLQRQPLEKLSAWQLDKWKSERIKAGLAPSTVNRDIAQLRAALSKAVAWGHLDANPANGVKPLRGGSEHRVRYLTKDEEKRLMRALDAREAKIRRERDSGNRWRDRRGYDRLPAISSDQFADHLKPLVLISMHTGLRWGELISLTWDNVSLNTDSAQVSVLATHAKSGKTRHVELNPTAIEVLRTWKSQAESTDGLVFPGRQGGKLDNVRRAWLAVLNAAEIKNFRWHDLRHCFASRLVMAGADLNTVRELLGHGSIAMTLKYAHLAPEHRAAAVRLIG